MPKSMAGATAVDESREKIILQALKAVKRGDFTVRLPVEWTGVMGKIADELNGIIERNALVADEFKRVFGQIYLRHVSENGRSMGRQSPPGIKMSETEIRGDAYVDIGKKKRSSGN